MGVRVWGVVEDRLIEVRVEPALSGGGIRVEGLPKARTRTTVDRVRAALVNSGLVREVPPAVIRLVPGPLGGRTSDLDLPLALATLAGVEVIGSGLRWVLATGRLGLDGTVHTADESFALVTIVTALSRGFS